MDTQLHIHGKNHGTLHNTGMPVILSIGTKVVRVGGCDNVTCTSPHNPTSALLIPLTTHRASRTDIPSHNIIAKQKTPPHIPGPAAGNIHTYQYRLHVHCPIPIIWPLQFAVEASEQAHYTNHTHTPEHPILRPLLCHHNHNTCIKAHTQPQTSPTPAL